MSPGQKISGSQDAMACGVLLVDSQERIVACTPGTAVYLGLDPARLSGLTLAALPDLLANFIRGANATAPSSGQILIKNGHNSAPSQINLWPLPGRNEMVVVLDQPDSVTVMQQNMQRLDRLASLGTLSAGLAHEIKNGMVAITTFFELLLQKGHDSELNEVVGRELKRIDAIVSQMLRFGAPSRAAFSTVRVHDVLDHSLRLVEHQMSGKLISLNRHYKAVPDTVSGDEFQLQQAFMNLLFNAIEAMGANGALTVGTEIVAGKQLQVQIQDTGVGIAPKNLERLFEPFFTTKKNGTGLGLSICRRIIHEHQGTIGVKSESQQGSTFSILLPVTDGF